MVLHHIFGKGILREKEFVEQSHFVGNFSVTLPRYTQENAEQVIVALETAKIPSKKERRRVMLSFQDFLPNPQDLETMCAMTGIARGIVVERIEQGKGIMQDLAESCTDPSMRRTLFVAQPANDPREPFWFIGNALAAGTPVVVKASKREPVLVTALAQYAEQMGLPAGYINVIHGDTSQREDSEALQMTVRLANIPIVMGDIQITERQTSFSADNSRALILSADAALHYLKESLESPLSCLAEHNLLVVGRRNTEKIITYVREVYSSMPRGDLQDPRTRMGKIEQATLVQIADLLSQGRINDTAHILYPEGLARKEITPEAIAEGVLVQHYSEDPRVEVNHLMDRRLPAYITAIRCVGAIDDAIIDLEKAATSIKARYGGKSMALAVYGEISSEYVRDRLAELAYEVHYNKSPSTGRGIHHQGINMQQLLSGREI